MSVDVLLERAKESGLTVFLEDGRVQVKAAQKPQGEARALINELRQHKQEVLEALTQEDPILSVDEWLPIFLDYQREVTRQVADCDIWGWSRIERPELYRELKTAESGIDNLSEYSVRLSEVMKVIKRWGDLVLRVQFEQQGFE